MDDTVERRLGDEGCPEVGGETPQDAEHLGSEVVKIKEELLDEDSVSESSTSSPSVVKQENAEVEIKEEDINDDFLSSVPDSPELKEDEDVEEMKTGFHCDLSVNSLNEREHTEILWKQEVGSPDDVMLAGPDGERLVGGHFLTALFSNSSGAKSSQKRLKKKKGYEWSLLTLRRQRKKKREEKLQAETTEEREERRQRHNEYRREKYRQGREREDSAAREHRLALVRARVTALYKKRKYREKAAQRYQEKKQKRELRILKRRMKLQAETVEEREERLRRQREYRRQRREAEDSATREERLTRARKRVAALNELRRRQRAREARRHRRPLFVPVQEDHHIELLPEIKEETMKPWQTGGLALDPLHLSSMSPDHQETSSQMEGNSDLTMTKEEPELRPNPELITVKTSSDKNSEKKGAEALICIGSLKAAMQNALKSSSNLL